MIGNFYYLADAETATAAAAAAENAVRKAAALSFFPSSSNRRRFGLRRPPHFDRHQLFYVLLSLRLTILPLLTTIY